MLGQSGDGDTFRLAFSNFLYLKVAAAQGLQQHALGHAAKRFVQSWAARQPSRAAQGGK